MRCATLSVARLPADPTATAFSGLLHGSNGAGPATTNAPLAEATARRVTVCEVEIRTRTRSRG
jgi:hypothetical protein